MHRVVRVVRNDTMRPLSALFNSWKLVLPMGTIFTKEHESWEALEISRDLNQQWFDWWTIPHFTLKRGANRCPRHGPTQAQARLSPVFGNRTRR